jgi:hypothetical protein
MVIGRPGRPGLTVVQNVAMVSESATGNVWSHCMMDNPVPAAIWKQKAVPWTLVQVGLNE